MTLIYMRWIVCAALSTACAAGNLTGQGIDAVKAEVDSLRVENVAWRKIPWKSCLLDGLAESRANGKPILLWIFIDRPIDDARC